jgi:uncharacterized protein YbjT (DUF2867 family)
MRRSKQLGIFILAALLGPAAAMAADKGTAVVVGGGQSGAPLAQALLDAGYTVRVVVRNPAKASGLPAKAQVVAGDVTQPATLAPALKGADYVLSTIGATCTPKQPFPPGGSPEDVDYRGIGNLAAAAKSAGVRQIVLLSSLGAGDTNPKAPLNGMCGMVLDWKGRGEASLRASGVPYTIVRPGGLKPFPGQPACEGGKEGLLLYARDGNGGAGSLCRTDVALVMADALGNKDALNKTVSLIGSKQEPVDGWRKAWASLPKDKD